MSRKLRVGVYVHSSLPFLRAGSETMLHAMLKALQDRGYEVRVALTLEKRAPQDWFYDGIDGFGHPERKGGPTAADQLAKWGPDVVITHHGESRKAAAFAKQHGAKLVFLVHNDRHFTKAFVSGMRPDLTVFNTRWIHSRFASFMRDLPAVVVHPMVDPEQHQTTPGYMVTLINLHKEKGSDTFYSLATRMPHLQFLGVKGGYWAQDVRSGSKYANVEVIANTANMRDDVWARTGVLLVPSQYESYGLVAVEAAASGIPVIASPTPGLKESMTLSTGEPAATFLRSHDVRGWQAALEKLSDPGFWVEWSNRSLARSKEIAAEDDLERFLGAFERVIGAPGR